MKKLSIIAMVCALLLTLSQCKKNETTTDGGEKVYVSVKIANGAKHEVNPETGVVTFAEGDVVHVASAGVYLGTLTYDGTQFSGDINEPTEGQKLQFYFLGNVTPDFSADNSQCSVVISDQTEHLPVISAAPSVEDYTAGLTNYTATLLHKCALVKFDVTTSSTAATCMKDFKNKVTLNFATNTFAYSKDGDGVITLPAGSGEQWAILLPQEALGVGSAYSTDGVYVGTREAVPAVYENAYFTLGISVTVITSLIPEGAISGLFTINGDGGQVFFSKGNLQYIGSAGNGDDNNTGAYWKFADNQWDYIGETTPQQTDSVTIDRDLFAWGTSGYNTGQVCYQPWSTSSAITHYYVYGSSDYNLFDQTGQADWGYNAIANGGDIENSGWRTLTKEEWGYLFDDRTDASSKYGFGKVNGVSGLILLPDDWTLPNGLSFTPGTNYFWVNDYSVDQWTQMEFNGAVFLPAAGWRQTSSLEDVGYVGRYWSSSYNNFASIGDVLFSTNYFISQALNYRRNFGSVRLARNVD